MCGASRAQHWSVCAAVVVANWTLGAVLAQFCRGDICGGPFSAVQAVGSFARVPHDQLSD